MVEGGEQAGFAREPLATFVIVGERRRKDFDGDVTPERMVAGAEHDAHPTGADRFGNLVMSDACTNSERHIQVGDILVPHSGAGDLRSHKNEVSPSARGGEPIPTYRDTFVR